jgi:hypothetical protein
MRQARLQGLKHASMIAERDEWFTRRHGTQVQITLDQHTSAYVSIRQRV